MSKHSMKRRSLQPIEHSADEPRTLRQAQAALRRAQIVEAALGLFARQGFDGTSTKQIARSAGVAEGLIFHYFPTKAQLLTAVLVGTAQTNSEVGAALSALIAEGIARLAMYLQGRVWAGELRADLPAESGAHMFFASLMIFFVKHRLLPADEWQQRADTFILEMVSVWLDGARA